MKNGEIINVNGKRVIFFRDDEGCSGCAFQNDSSCPEDCDYGKFFELPNPWHTGTPTEEGWFYAVICKGWGRPYNRLALVDDGKIYCLDDASDFEDFPHEIVKYREVWQFKGNQEKSEEISPNSEET